MPNEITSILQPLASKLRAPGQARGASQPTVVEKPAIAQGDRVSLTNSARLLQLADSKSATVSAPRSDSSDVDKTYARTDSSLQPASNRLSTEGNAQRPSPAMTNMMEAFLSTSDMKEFDVNSDLNSDGVINFQDLAALRAKETGPGPGLSEKPPNHLPTEGNAQRPSPAMANMMEAFLSTSEMKGFDVNSDLNSDGVINFQDLAALRGKEAGVGPVPPEQLKEQFQNMTESFFSSEGSDGFDAGSDLNDDGMINFHDLAILRSKMENS